MLAGLIFATHDAVDRPDALAATLPFGGMTIIEYQARLLVGAGVSQIIVVVARLTPELLGAINRMGRRGVSVDAVRNAAEATEKLHPLARILMLADGLITTEPVIALLSGDGGDALMVLEEDHASGQFERLGGQIAWAGVARLEPQRLTEVARLPGDYDMQSTLLRVASQARARHLMLPAEALADGHGVERRASAAAQRGRAIFAAMVSRKIAWFDRFVVAPLARFVLPRLVERGVPNLMLAIVATVLTLAGIGGLWTGFAGAGLAALLVASIILSIGATLAGLRDQTRFANAEEGAITAIAMIGALLAGRWADLASGASEGMMLAIVAIVAGAIAERASAPDLRRRSWASPPGLLLVLTLFTAVGLPTVGLAVAAAYAAVTVLAGVEALRRQS